MILEHKRRQPLQKNQCRVVLIGSDTTDVISQSNHCGIAIVFYLTVGPRDELMTGQVLVASALLELRST